MGLENYDEPLSPCPSEPTADDDDGAAAVGLDEEFYQEKQNLILSCLEGERGASEVDLWKLRELALTKGGLLSPTVRKRAWLVLTQCHVDILSTPEPKKETYYNSIETKDLEALRIDIKAKKHAWCTTEPNGQLILDQGSSVCSCGDLSATENDGSVVSGGISLCNACLNNKNQRKLRKRIVFNIVSTVLRQKPKRMTESKLNTELQTTKINETSSAPNSKENSDRLNSEQCFHYYAGLADLTNLLLNNLESSSLVTLVLGKLANCHLRDALGSTNATRDESMQSSRISRTRKGTNPLEKAVLLTFLPLLRTVDSSVYQALIKACQELHPDGLAAGIQTMSSVVTKHVATWFCTCADSNDNHTVIRSRLADVFLVSHPLMPIYMAVSMLTVQRRKREDKSGTSLFFPVDNNCDLESHLHGLFHLSSFVSLGGRVLSPSEIIEEVIATAISYIKHIPPQTLVEMATSPKNHRSTKWLGNLRNVTLLRTVPLTSWSTVDTTPTEWQLIQRNADLKGPTKKVEATTKEGWQQLQHLYPLASASSGIFDPDSRQLDRQLSFNTCFSELKSFGGSTFQNHRGDGRGKKVTAAMHNAVKVRVACVLLLVVMTMVTLFFSMLGSLSQITSLGVVDNSTDSLGVVDNSTESLLEPMTYDLISALQTKTGNLMKPMASKDDLTYSSILVASEDILRTRFKINLSIFEDMLRASGDLFGLLPLHAPASVGNETWLLNNKPFTYLTPRLERVALESTPVVKNVSTPSEHFSVLADDLVLPNFVSTMNVNETTFSSLDHTSSVPTMGAIRNMTESGESCFGRLKDWASRRFLSFAKGKRASERENVPQSLAAWKPNLVHHVLYNMIQMEEQFQSIVRHDAKSSIAILRVHGWTKMSATATGFHLLKSTWKHGSKAWNRHMDSNMDRIGRKLFLHGKGKQNKKTKATNDIMRSRS